MSPDTETVDVLSCCLTLHQLEGSVDIVLPGPDEADQQAVWFLSESVLNTFGEIIASVCLLLYDPSQLLHRRHPLLVCLVQLVLGLQGVRQCGRFKGIQVSMWACGVFFFSLGLRSPFAWCGLAGWNRVRTRGHGP